MRRWVLRIALVIPLLSTIACAGWRSQIDPNALRYDQVASAQSPAPTKRLLVTLTVVHPGIQQGNLERRTSQFRRKAVEIIGASGHFTEVGTNIAKPDLELVLSIHEEEHFSRALTGLSALTLFVFPAVDRVETHTVGEIFSGTGEKLGDVHGGQSRIGAISWLLLPAIPSAVISERRSVEDLFKSVLVQLLENDRVWQ